MDICLGRSDAPELYYKISGMLCVVTRSARQGVGRSKSAAPPHVQTAVFATTIHCTVTMCTLGHCHTTISGIVQCYIMVQHTGIVKTFDRINIQAMNILISFLYSRDLFFSPYSSYEDPLNICQCYNCRCGPCDRRYSGNTSEKLK